MVNGAAAGAGVSLAIAGDVALAGPTALFRAAYGALGLSPEIGGSLREFVGDATRDARLWALALTTDRRSEAIRHANQPTGGLHLA